MGAAIFVRGESVPIYAIDKSWAGAPLDPTAGVVIYITDPAGTLKVNGEAMSLVTSGTYLYNYNTDSESELGQWRWQCVAIDGTGAEAKTVISEGGFLLTETR
ncbi:MAG: hypothetical protein WC261_14810 [Synergistaceae bacterium]|jgi:hypothetical protein